MQINSQVFSATATVFQSPVDETVYLEEDEEANDVGIYLLSLYGLRQVSGQWKKKNKVHVKVIFPSQLKGTC